MPAAKRDPGYLWDMLEAARAVQEWVEETKFYYYQQNRLLQAGVERMIEIIGEAARHVSEGFKKEHPEIPWKRMISQRNVLAHEYGEIKQEKLWILASEGIPVLIAQLEKLVPSPPAEYTEQD